MNNKIIIIIVKRRIYFRDWVVVEATVSAGLKLKYSREDGLVKRVPSLEVASELHPREQENAWRLLSDARREKASLLPIYFYS